MPKDLEMFSQYCASSHTYKNIKYLNKEIWRRKNLKGPSEATYYQDLQQLAFINILASLLSRWEGLIEVDFLSSSSYQVVKLREHFLAYFISLNDRY